MTDRLLDKYIKRDGVAGDGDQPRSESEGVEDFGSFGWLRGIRDRALMLELQRTDGHVVAIGYAWLERAEFDPSVGITLHVLGQRVRIKGRNLNGVGPGGVGLFSGVCRHRVPWIRESDHASDIAAGGDETVIDGIEW